MHRNWLVALITLLLAPALAYAADGKAMYEKECARCHGADGKSETPVGRAMKVPSLLNQKWAGDDAVAAIVEKIRAHVPKAKEMSDAEIEAAATYAHDLAKGAQ